MRPGPATCSRRSPSRCLRPGGLAGRDRAEVGGGPDDPHRHAAAGRRAGPVPVAGTFAGLYAALAILGIGQALNVPALQSLISRTTAADDQGSMLGVTQGFSSLARVIGPSVEGPLRHSDPLPLLAGRRSDGGGFLLATRVVRRRAARRSPDPLFVLEWARAPATEGGDDRRIHVPPSEFLLKHRLRTEYSPQQLGPQQAGLGRR